MQAQLEVRNQLERRFTISVPHKEVAEKMNTRLCQIAKTAKINGFRPGKAPIKVVAQHYHHRVEKEVLDEIMLHNFNQAVQENELHIVGHPYFEVGQDSDYQQSDLEFFATFEVFPDIVIGDLTSVEVEKPMTEVGDADVERIVRILRSSYAHYEPVDRAAMDGDRVAIDFSGTVDGKPFSGGTGENFICFLGDDSIPPDFEAGIIGMHENETKVIETQLPDRCPEKLVGKTAQYQVTLKKVFEVQLPAVDKDFIKKFGIEEDEALFYKELKKTLCHEAKKRLKFLTMDNVVNALIKVTPIPLPHALVWQEEVDLFRETYDHLKEGRSFDLSLLELVKARAKNRVHARLVVNAFVKKHGLEAKPEQIRSIIEEEAQDYDNPEEVVSSYYADPNQLQQAQAIALQENVVEYVYSLAKVIERTVPFKTLLQNHPKF